ncbi:MAG: sulfatase-like hydrolase/transferase, partial [Planctomycetota bacterium]
RTLMQLRTRCESEMKNMRLALITAVILGISPVFMDHCSAERPNVLMIFTDDQGYNDVGCYGSEIHTPALDRLAEQGMRFTQFYAASSICTPSRFGLLTGMYPHRSEDSLLDALMFMDPADLDRGIRAHESTYPSALQRLGYQTHLVGKWHLGHGNTKFWPTKHGFDTFFGHTGGCVDFFTLNYGNLPDWYRGTELVETDGYATDVITDEAVKIIARSKGSHQPLYLHVSYNAPHFGKAWNQKTKQTENIMQPKAEDLAKVSGIDEPLRRAFAAKTIGLDESIGKLLAALDQHELADETLVIFMTDHGGEQKHGGSNLPLRGNKATLYEGGIRVPCIVRWPDRIAAGSVCDAVTCAIDWFPTLMEICDEPVDSDKLDGRSMWSAMTKQTPQPNRHLVWKTSAHQTLQRKAWLAVRDGKWKWVRGPNSDTPGELYDLETDRQETVNLVERFPSIAERLAALASADN